MLKELLIVGAIVTFYGLMAYVVWRNIAGPEKDDRAKCLSCGRPADAIMAYGSRRFYVHARMNWQDKPDMCSTDFSGNAVDEEAPGIGDS